MRQNKRYARDLARGHHRTFFSAAEAWGVKTCVCLWIIVLALPAGLVSAATARGSEVASRGRRPPVAGHVLELKDGRVLVGEFVDANSTIVRFRLEDGNVETFKIAQVVAIRFTTRGLRSTKEAKTVRVRLDPGTPIRVRVTSVVTSATANAGDRFFAVLVDDIVAGGVVVSKSGKRVFGRVRKVVRPKRGLGPSSLELVLSDLTVGGKARPIITDFVGITNDGKGTISAAEKGRVVSALPGFADGKRVRLSPGAELEFRLAQPAAFEAP